MQDERSFRCLVCTLPLENLFFRPGFLTLMRVQPPVRDFLHAWPNNEAVMAARDRRVARSSPLIWLFYAAIIFFRVRAPTFSPLSCSNRDIGNYVYDPNHYKFSERAGWLSARWVLCLLARLKLGYKFFPFLRVDFLLPWTQNDGKLPPHIFCSMPFCKSLVEKHWAG